MKKLITIIKFKTKEFAIDAKFVDNDLCSVLVNKVAYFIPGDDLNKAVVKAIEIFKKEREMLSVEIPLHKKKLKEDLKGLNE